METNIVLFTVILLLAFLVVSLAMLYKNIDTLRSDMNTRFDSSHQSPDAMNKLHTLVEQLEPKQFVSRLDSVERNLHSKLMAMSERHSSLPDTEKIEQLLSNVVSSSANAISLELKNLETQISALQCDSQNSAEVSAAVAHLDKHIEILAKNIERATAAVARKPSEEPLGVKEISPPPSPPPGITVNQLNDLKSSLTETLKQDSIIERLDETREQLNKVTKLDERVRRLAEQLRLAVETLSESNDLKQLKDSITALTERISEGSSAHDSALKDLRAKIQNVLTISTGTYSNIEKLDAMHENLKSRIIVSDQMRESHKQLESAIRQHHESLHAALMSKFDDTSVVDLSSGTKQSLRTLVETACAKKVVEPVSERLKTIETAIEQLPETWREDLRSRVLSSLELEKKLDKVLSQTSKDAENDEALARHVEETNELLETLKSSTMTNIASLESSNREALARVYDDFVAELGNSEHYSSIMEQLKVSIEKANDAATKAIESSVSKLSESYDALKTELKANLKESVDDVTEKSKDSIDGIAKTLRLSIDELRTMVSEKSVDATKLLHRITANSKIINAIRTAIKANDETIASLNTGMQKLLTESNLAISSRNKAIERMDELEKQMTSLGHRLPEKIEFWNDITEIRDTLKSHASSSTDDLAKLLTAMQRVTEKLDSGDSSLREALKSMEDRIASRLMTDLQSVSDPEKLEPLVGAILKTESAEALIASNDLKLQKSLTILERLERLSDIDFASLNKKANSEMLEILRTIKTQSDVQKIINVMYGEQHGKSERVNLIQRAIDRLNDNETKVSTMIDKLDGIAKKVNSIDAWREKFTASQPHEYDKRIDGIANELGVLAKIINNDSTSNKIESNASYIRDDLTGLTKLLKSKTNETGTLINALKLDLARRTEYNRVQIDEILKKIDSNLNATNQHDPENETKKNIAVILTNLTALGDRLATLDSPTTATRVEEVLVKTLTERKSEFDHDLSETNAKLDTISTILTSRVDSNEIRDAGTKIISDTKEILGKLTAMEQSHAERGVSVSTTLDPNIETAIRKSIEHDFEKIMKQYDTGIGSLTRDLVDRTNPIKVASGSILLELSAIKSLLATIEGDGVRRTRVIQHKLKTLSKLSESMATILKSSNATNTAPSPTATDSTSQPLSSNNDAKSNVPADDKLPKTATTADELSSSELAAISVELKRFDDTIMSMAKSNFAVMEYLNSTFDASRQTAMTESIDHIRDRVDKIYNSMK